MFRCPGGERLREAVGADFKGKSSPAFYIAGILLCLVSTYAGLAVYTVVALMWLIPDARIARVLHESERGPD